MQGWIAPTDPDWFDFLSRHGPFEEVNFWTPSAHFTFRAEPGTPFLFKLKAPHSAIAGFGFFQRYDALPEWLAWEAFGKGNGASSFDEMKARLTRIRQRNRMQDSGELQQIGCIILAHPVFLPREHWTPQPSDWPWRNLRPMRYDLGIGEGKRVWDHCLPAAVAVGLPEAPVGGDPLAERYGDAVLVRPRLGQGAFRLAVTAAYGRACAMTGEHSLPALESAHIRPFAEGGPHDLSNGLLLRSDIHRLFDKGYVTVRPDYSIDVSGLLREHFQNGKSYYPLRGEKLASLPERVADRPDPELLRWHYENRFLG